MITSKETKDAMLKDMNDRMKEKMTKKTQKPPVKVGDVLKLGVVRFGRERDPIMIYQDYIIFLKGIEKRGVELNTMIKIKITKVLPKFAFAERVNE